MIHAGGIASYRRSVLTALSFLILAASPAQPQNGEGQRRQALGGDHHKQAAPLSVKQVTGTPDHQATQKGCEGTDERNLSCEAMTAEAARAQAQDADWQAWAAALGVIVGLLTLGAAFWAARWAKKAAEHTGTGVEIAAAAQRAWITITAEILHAFVTEGGHSIFFNIRITFKNVGQTVARNVQYHAEFVAEHADNHSVYSELRSSFDQTSAPGPVTTIVPGETRTFLMETGASYDMIKNLNPEGTLYRTAFGFCDYSVESDGERHRTDSSFMLVMRNRRDLITIGVPFDPLPSAEEMAFEGGSIVAT